MSTPSHHRGLGLRLVLVQSLLLLASAQGSNSGSDVTCYCKNSRHGITSDQCYELVPCYRDGAPVQRCCVVGDTCGADGLCGFSHGGVPRTSGYYQAGCTDPTFTDPACPKQCTDRPSSDVVYNQTTALWACCFSEPDQRDVDCGRPGDVTFQAAAPAELDLRAPASAPPAASSSAPASASDSASATTATATSAAASATAAAASSATAPTGLSAGAKAGIGVGVGVVGAALLAALAFALARRRRQQLGREGGVEQKLGTYRGGEVTESSRLSDAETQEREQAPHAI